MKKALYILSAVLLGLVSCNKTEFESIKPKEVEPTGLVAVTMKVQIPQVELYAQTKADGQRSHLPDIQNIRVAVFGTSGYPQAYALAEPIKSATDESAGSYASTNYEDEDDIYYFKVLLPVYDGEAHVHIIANGPESIKFVDETEESIMTQMRSEKGIGAFWARIVMPDGILTQLDQNGIMQTDDEGNFIPNDGTAHLFEDLVLVRNFAEVRLQSNVDESELSEISWTLVNVPTMGSVAPMAARTWVDDYKDYEYNTEDGTMVNVNTAKVYDGFMFEDEPMDYSIPAPEAITTSVDDPGFVYERVHPGDDKATCILMKAKFRTDKYFTYYRLDLTDENVGGYFPLYRNYMYQMTIKKVGNRGAKTPTEAMNRDSGGNVSLSTEAKKLTDISDGVSRLYVEYVEKNFTSGGKQRLWVQYVPDVTTGTVDNSKVNVAIKTQGNALIEGATITKTGESSDTGYYFYEFELNEQDENEDLVSVLQVTASNGKDGDDKSTLYRDITLRVMKKMDMTLKLVPKKVDGQGSATVLEIGLPEGLPESMFPLEIKIEDVNHSLYSTGLDGDGNEITVPVKTDKSLVDGTTNSFYFIRTVNRSEYEASTTITTQFKTNKDASATTIYVANVYFKTQTINLLNDGMYVNPTQATVPFNTTSVEVEVEFAEPAGKTWTVAAETGITSITDKDGATFTGGTGNGTFILNFPINNTTTGSVTRTATVRYNGTNHTVTIIQSPLEFSITTDTPQVNYNATTATVTVHAEEGISWTATITGPNGVSGYSLSETSGTGSKTLTVTLPANNTNNARNYTIQATQTNPAGSATLTLTQRRQPNQNGTATFNSNNITVSNNAATVNSTDGYITLDYRNVNKTYTYVQMSNGNAYGFATVTPNPGVRITYIEFTAYNATQAGRISVSSGTLSGNGATRTWTVNSTEPVTMTATNNGNSAPYISSIVVHYEPI